MFKNNLTYNSSRTKQKLALQSNFDSRIAPFETLLIKITFLKVQGSVKYKNLVKHKCDNLKIKKYFAKKLYNFLQKLYITNNLFLEYPI